MNDPPHISRLTKRRWDRLLLPIAIISTVCAALLGFFAGFWDAFTLPVFTFAGWIYFRLTTPSSGIKAVSIKGNPKVKALLGWLAFVLLLSGAWAFVDVVVLGNSIHSPIGAPQIILFIALIVLLLGGIMVIEHRFPSTREEPKNL